MDPNCFIVEAREDGYYIGDVKVSDEMAREILGIVKDSLPQQSKVIIKDELPTYDDLAFV